MKRIKNNREGFSLIEMIITIAIVAIVMGGVLLLITHSTSSMRRTTNAVNLQNEAKDALLHMTTYLQEGSDAHWDATNKALIVVKKVKNLEGDPVSLEVSHYWFHPDSTTPPDPSVTEERGIICFCKRVYDKTDASWASYLNEDGSVNYAPLTLDYDGVIATEGIEPLVFAKNVIGFECAINDNSLVAAASATPSTDPTVSESPLPSPSVSPVASATPTASSDPAASATPVATPESIGGKYVKITINMKNELGDAQFTSSKEVFMRNR